MTCCDSYPTQIWSTLDFGVPVGVSLAVCELLTSFEDVVELEGGSSWRD